MRDWNWRWAAGAVIGLAWAMGTTALADPPVQIVSPIVPGYIRLKDEARAPAAELGEVLLGELNCLQCHSGQDQKRIFTKGAPDLNDAGARMTPQYIRAYLSDNHGMKPGTTMPDLFHSSDPRAKAGAVEYLTHYLVSLGGPIKPSAIEGSSLLVDRGRQLFQKIGCVACHAPEKAAAATIPSIPFPNLARKTTFERLQAFLLDPAKVRPGGRMPSLNLTRDEALDLAVYLLRDQLDNPQNGINGPTRVAGLKYAYYELQPRSAAIERFERLRPKSQGTIDRFTLDIPGRRDQDFAIKFSGALHVPKAGKYTFTLNSDDGSRLYISRQLVVDDDGTHPAEEKSGEVELAEGDQPIVVTYFQGGGEFVLNVSWQGPGFDKQEIPADALYSIGGKPMVPLSSESFAVDPEKAKLGQTMFAAMGCASCHAIAGVKAMSERKSLAELNVDSPSGCLGDQVARSTPNYHLDADQKAALKAALKNVKELDQPLEPKKEVMHLAAAFNCFACHVRANAGGPTSDRAPMFVMSAEFDMGDEGRFPPKLSGVGAKLTPDAIRQVIFENKLHVRPVLATRMPTFSREKAGPIVDDLVRADAPANPPAAPQFGEIVAKDGRTLFGTRGLGCVNCHGINGTKLTGSMPAPDLGNAHERLTYAWFRELLVDPAKINPSTRMPGFWPKGEVALKNLAGGTEDAQIAALWTYMSLGKSMPLPSGLQPSNGDELIPTDVPIVHRTFFSGAGNRSVAVGFPEMIHVVFDADVVRLAKSWKGRFFDARGMWQGRGGDHLGPLGTDVIDLPPGPSFAVLESPNAPWPLPRQLEHSQTTRDLGGKFKGYTLDKEDRPIFHYVLNDVDITEQPLPILKAGGADLERRFHLEAKQPVKDLTFLAAQGKSIEEKSPGNWVVDGKLKIKVSGQQNVGKPFVRTSKGNRQLLLPIALDKGNASAFSVEMSW